MKSRKIDWCDVWEAVVKVIITVVFIGLLFCGLEFGIHNFILMTTAVGVKAVIHFFVGVTSVIFFAAFCYMIIDTVKQKFVNGKNK